MINLTKLHKKLSTLLQSPEYFFVFIAASFGLLFLIIVPPFQTPDENVHLYRAFEVAQFNIPHKQEKTNNVGSYLPLSIRQTEIRVHGAYGLPGTKGSIMFNDSEKYDYRFTKSALFDIPLNKNDKIFYQTASSPSYMPLNYIPQAAMAYIGTFVNLPVIAILYMIRFINLVLWIGMAFTAIRIFPWKKWALVGICLLPMVVSQTMSPGLDVITFGCALIFLSVIVKLSMRDENSKVGIAHILGLTLLGILMIFGKSVLVALLPLVFMIKSERFNVRYAKLAKLLIALVPIIMYMVWVFVSKSFAAIDTTMQGAQQIHTFMHNPLVFISSFVNTIFFITPSGDILAQSIIGNFGWLDTPLSPPFVIFGYVALAFMMLVNYEKTNLRNVFTKSRKTVLTIVSIIYTTLVFLAMYLYFTSPGEKFIRGVNGRYLFPLLVMLIPLTYASTLRVDKRKYVLIVKFSSIFLLCAGILTIIFRYYINF